MRTRKATTSGQPKPANAFFRNLWHLGWDFRETASSLTRPARKILNMFPSADVFRVYVFLRNPTKKADINDIKSAVDENNGFFLKNDRESYWTITANIPVILTIAKRPYVQSVQVTPWKSELTRKPFFVTVTTETLEGYRARYVTRGHKREATLIRCYPRRSASSPARFGPR